jgi:outer membrane protein assembly factor BamB
MPVNKKLRKQSFNLFILTAGILSILAGCLIPPPPTRSVSSLHPPFKKIWEFKPSIQSEQFSDHIIEGDIFYYATGSRYGAVDLRTGLPIWEGAFPSSASYPIYLAKTQDALFVAVSNWALIACDPSNGQVRWSIPIPGWAGPLLAQDGRLYFESQDGKFVCMDTGTRTILWSTTLEMPSKPETCGCAGAAVSSRPMIMGDKVFIGRNFAEVLALDANTGKIIWKSLIPDKLCSPIVGFTNDGRRIYCTVASGQVCSLEADTGKILWSYQVRENIKYLPILHDGMLLFIDSKGALFALNKITGAIVWRRTLGGDHVSQPYLGNKAILVASGSGTFIGVSLSRSESNLFAIDYSGKSVWKWDYDEAFAYDSYVIPASAGYYLLSESRLSCLAKTDASFLGPDSESKKAMANRLVARLGSLTAEEESALVKLGDAAFEPLMKIFKAYLLQEQNSNGVYVTIESFDAADSALELLVNGSHAPLLLKLLQLTPSEEKPKYGRNRLFGLLAETGSDLALPVFIDEINNSRQTIDEFGMKWHSGGYGSGIYYMLHSMHPKAVEFLIEKMLDPNAEPELRHQAFLALPNTGGAAGLDAVLKARDRNRTIPTLAEYMHLDNLVESSLEEARANYNAESNSFLNNRLLDQQADDHGQRWGLVQSSALGSGDLWIVKWDGRQWTDPVFTGVDLEEMKTPDWIKAYVQNPALMQDTDGDGWTDLIEGRLGTDALNPDTDGDGLSDPRDRNPLAKAGPEGEVQKILAAAFEASYRFYAWRPVPCIVEMPEGVEPFELAGWESIILSKRHEGKLPLDAIERRGVGLIHFALPQSDFGNDTLQKLRKGDVILWNKDRTEAKVHVVQYFGMLDAGGDDVRLKKFGNHWVVIEIKPIWAS